MSQKFWISIMLTIVFAFILAAPTLAFAQFEQLTKWIPDDANSLVLIQVDDICRSPVAIEKEWPQQYAAVCQAGMDFLPTGMKRFAVASHIDYQFMEPLWTAAIYEKTGNEIRIEQVAEMTGGMVDTLAGYDAVALREDVFLVKTGSNTAASIAPANRQSAIRWLQRRKASQPTLSSYLKKAASFADQNADLIAAFDLGDLLSKNQIKEWLDGSKSIDSSKKEAALEVISTIQGITLGVTVKDELNAAVKVDFGSDPEVLKENGKDIFLELLGKSGMMIDDFREFKTEKYDNQLRFVGTMSPEGIRKIGLLINHPVKNAIGFGGSESRSSISNVARARQYFQSIMTIVSEFDRKQEVHDLGLYAKWFDRHARQIDELPVTQLDKELVDFGQFVSESFRDIASNLRKAELDENERRALYPRYGYRCGRYGCYYYGYPYGQDNIELERGLKSAKDILAELNKEAAQLRKVLSQKHGVQF